MLTAILGLTPTVHLQIHPSPTSLDQHPPAFITKHPYPHPSLGHSRTTLTSVLPVPIATATATTTTVLCSTNARALSLSLSLSSLSRRNGPIAESSPPTFTMPMCGGTKSVQRKLVLLYVCFMRGSLFVWATRRQCDGTWLTDFRQRRRRMRQDFVAERFYKRVGPNLPALSIIAALTFV